MSNAIATVSVKLIADTTGFATGIVRKDLKEIDQILRDSSPQLDSHARKVKVLDAMYKDNTIGVDEYKKALAGLNDKLAATKSPGGIATPSATDPTGGLGSLASQKAGNLPIVGDLMQAAGVAGPAGIAVAGAFAAMAAGAAVATIATKELVGIVLTGIDRLDAIGDEAAALGMSASGFQKLQIAATLADAPAEALFNTIGKMEEILGDPSEAAIKAYDKLGLSTEKLKEMGPAAFELIAKKIAELPTKAERFVVLGDVAGKVDKRIINLVENMQAALDVADKFARTDDQFAAISKADDAMKELKLSTQGMADIVASELAPIVTDIASALSDVLQADVTQSSLYTGIIVLKDTFDGLKASIDVVKTVATADVGGGGSVGEAMLKSTDWKTQLVGKGLGLLANPFSDQAAAEAEGRRLDKVRKDKEKAATAADAAAEVASGSMTEQEFNAWLKGWKEQEKAAEDFAKKLKHVADEASAYGNTQDEMRLKAMDAGAASEDQINSYVEQLKKLDDAKKLRKEQDETQKEFEKSLDERDKKKAKFIEDGLTKQEKAERDIRDAQAAGVTGQDMDRLRDKLAKELVPKTADQVVSGATKGSQEAYAAIARAGRVSAQEVLLKEIRDSLRRQERIEPVVVVEETVA